MKVVNLQWAECERRALEVANQILDIDKPRATPIALYGVPNGGLHAATLIREALEKLLMTVATIVETPEDADYIVDDLENESVTRKTFEKDYPSTPFFALYEKTYEDVAAGVWYSFPWERDHVPAVHVADSVYGLLAALGQDPHSDVFRNTAHGVETTWRRRLSGIKFKDVEDGYYSNNMYPARTPDVPVLLANIPVYSTNPYNLEILIGTAFVSYRPTTKCIFHSTLIHIVKEHFKTFFDQHDTVEGLAQSMYDNLEAAGVGVVVVMRYPSQEISGLLAPGECYTHVATRGTYKEQPVEEGMLELLAAVSETD